MRRRRLLYRPVLSETGQADVTGGEGEGRPGERDSVGQMKNKISQIKRTEMAGPPRLARSSRGLRKRKRRARGRWLRWRADGGGGLRHKGSHI